MDTPDFFRNRLATMLDGRHPLMVLADSPDGGLAVPQACLRRIRRRCLCALRRESGLAVFLRPGVF